MTKQTREQQHKNRQEAEGVMSERPHGCVVCVILLATENTLESGASGPARPGPA